MKLIKLLIIFMALSLSTFAQSRIKAKQYSIEYGEILMYKYGTSSAKNIEVEIIDIETTAYGYIMELQVSWDDRWGAIFKEDIKCILKGVYTVDYDGRNDKFKETYRNNAFSKIEQGRENDRLLTNIAKEVVNSNKSTTLSNLSIYNSRSVDITFYYSLDGYTYSTAVIKPNTSIPFNCEVKYFRIITWEGPQEKNRKEYKLECNMNYEIYYISKVGYDLRRK